ncbi:MAG: rhomboid family intramembrane serine protease [Candidatus Obscuribacterales bacterium]|nr:rhomboid family intramembrane serine protease [Candidatus Obscuribacterales bacterium]
MFPLYDENDNRESCGVVNHVLIVLNLICMAMQLCVPSMTDFWALKPAMIAAHQQSILNLVSHCFLHGGFGHIAGNMWYLFIFGDNVEDMMGSGNYLFFYLSCGLLSGLGECLFAPATTTGFIGASGAISGVMAAYLVFYPGSRVRTFIGIPFYFPKLPAWILLVSFFLENLLLFLLDQNMSLGVSFVGHLSGFFAGLLLCRIAAQRRSPL